MCETSNNSSIEMAQNKNMAHASDELAKLDSIFSSNHIKKKIKNIKEIVGDKAHSGLSSNLVSPEESR